jgi:peroxiredoxin
MSSIIGLRGPGSFCLARVFATVALGLAGCATTHADAPPAEGAAPAAAAPAATPAAATGQVGSLPDFRIPDVDGNVVRLSDYVGKKVILLDFWATWCGPCADELPHLEALYKKYQGQGFVVIGIAMDDTTTMSNVAPFARKYGLTFPVALDNESRAVSLYNTTKTAPYLVLIDRQGKVVQQRGGYTPGDERIVETWVQQQL